MIFSPPKPTAMAKLPKPQINEEDLKINLKSSFFVFIFINSVLFRFFNFFFSKMTLFLL